MYRKSGSSTARRAKGNIRASMQMRDQSNVTLQGIVQVPVNVTNLNAAPATDGAYANLGNAVGVSIWQLAFMSQFYNNYKNMYDQMKLNGFRCKILGNSASSVTMASGLSSVSVVTAFDRNGVQGNPFVSTVPEVGSSARSSYLDLGGTAVAAVNQVLSYGSAKSKPWSPGNSFNQWISGYAQTAQETQQWIATDKLKTTTVSVTADGENRIKTWNLGYPSGLSNPGLFTAKNVDPEAMDEYDANNKYSKTAQALAASPIYWDPVLLIGVYNVPAIAAAVAANQTFTFTVEYKIDVSFRGTRSGTITNPAAERVEGTEILQTLNVAVDPGEVVNIEPTTGSVWNHAVIEGNPPDSSTLNLGTLHAGDVIDRSPPLGEYYNRVIAQVDAGDVDIVADPVGVDNTGNLLPGTTDIWPGIAANSFIVTNDPDGRLFSTPLITGNKFPRQISIRINALEYLYPILRATLVPRDEPYRFNEGPYDSAYIEVPPPQYDKLVRTFVGNGKFTGEGLYNGYEIYVNSHPGITLTMFSLGDHEIRTVDFDIVSEEVNIPLRPYAVLIEIRDAGLDYDVRVTAFRNTESVSRRVRANTACYVFNDPIFSDDSVEIYSENDRIITFDATYGDGDSNDWLYLNQSYFEFAGIYFE